MPINLTLSMGTLFSFLLVMARVSGAIAFVPLPGLSGVVAPARVVLALGFTMALSSRWPMVEGRNPTPGILLAWVAAEAATGIAMGVCITVVVETFAFGAQVFGLPAGFGYAQTIDPTTQADSGILVVLAQLVAGMLFFALGLDREVLRLFAQSLDRVPVGVYPLSAASALPLIHLGSNIFSVGLRLALPVVALLMMVDVALALIGRLNAQLQLHSLSFTAKMLVALLILGWVGPLFPRVLMELGGHAWSTARRILGI